MRDLLLWLWRLLPANPLMLHIIHTAGRRRAHLWVRMGYLGVLICLVLLALAGTGALRREVGITALAQAGSHLFVLISYGQVLLVCLISPFLLAGVLSPQHAGHNLDLLLASPLSGGQLVLGLLAGRLFFVLAILASGLPLFAVLMAFGGLPTGAVVVAFAAAGMTAVLLGSAAVTLAALRLGGSKAVFTFVAATAAYLTIVYALDLGRRA